MITSPSGEEGVVVVDAAARTIVAAAVGRVIVVEGRVYGAAVVGRVDGTAVVGCEGATVNSNRRPTCWTGCLDGRPRLLGVGAKERYSMSELKEKWC